MKRTVVALAGAALAPVLVLVWSVLRHEAKGGGE